MGLVNFIKENSPDAVQVADNDTDQLIEEEVEEDDEIEVKRTRVTDTMKILIRVHTHTYDAKGRHDHFRYLLSISHYGIKLLLVHRIN
jgi:hypothetical protein